MLSCLKRSSFAAVCVIAVVAFIGGATAADRVVVEFEKVKTDAAGGLEYEYTFEVKKHGSGEVVEGADFMISTDMPSMPGAHHMPHVKAVPGHHPGSYKAKLDFDMAGEWTLILKFSKPHRDQVTLSDMVAGGDGDMKMDHSSHGEGKMDHSKQGGEKSDHSKHSGHSTQSE